MISYLPANATQGQCLGTASGSVKAVYKKFDTQSLHGLSDGIAQRDGVLLGYSGPRHVVRGVSLEDFVWFTCKNAPPPTAGTLAGQELNSENSVTEKSGDHPPRSTPSTHSKIYSFGVVAHENRLDFRAQPHATGSRFFPTTTKPCFSDIKLPNQHKFA